MNTVSKNISRLRKEKGMTQDELAASLHVTRQTVSNWENEKNQPDIDTLTELAEIFGTDVNELIYGSKKTEYAPYQRRFVRAAAICAALVLLLLLARGILLPRFMHYTNSTYTHHLDYLFVSLLTDALLYWVLGYGLLSVFSLWFSCAVRRSKGLLLCALLALVPLVVMTLEYLLLTLALEKIPMLVFDSCLIHPWCKALFLHILPALSGILFFLNFSSSSR